MKTCITSCITIAALAFTPAAFAQSQKFEADMTGTIDGPINLKVVLSDSLAARANMMPGDSAMDSAFSAGGYLGSSSLQALVDETFEEMTEDLEKSGIPQDGNSRTVLVVTIEDAKNNRPTPKQLGKEPGLSADSFGIGGATLSAELTNTKGEVIGTMNYAWYDSLDGSGTGRANGIWTDADKAISRFASRAARSIRRKAGARSGRSSAGRTGTENTVRRLSRG